MAATAMAMAMGSSTFVQGRRTLPSAVLASARPHSIPIAMSLHTLQRLASFALVAASLLIMMLSYREMGLMAQPHVSYSVVPLLFSGLLLGRKALWITLVVCVCTLLLALLKDLGQPLPIGPLGDSRITPFVQQLATCVIVALVTDRLLVKSQHAERRGNEALDLYHRLEQEMARREQSQRQLEHARKMDAIGRLASSAAHEFNNYLALINGHAEHAQGASSPADANTHLAGVRNATSRAKRMTQRLLALSRYQSEPLRTFDAIESLRELLVLIRPMFPRSTRVEFPPPAAPAFIRMARDDFEIAVLNAARNSSQAMTAGGEFRIEVGVAAGTVVIDVIDDGCGISEDVIDRIFEPFFTTKSGEQGTGLGLSTAYRSIVEANGDMRVSSTPGVGTRVSILLPLQADTAENIAFR